MCDIGYLIRDHVPAVLQGLSNDLIEYKIPLQPSRCYYTGILMMYMLLGLESLNNIGYCDVPSIRSRFSTSNTSSTEVSNQLLDEMFSNKGHSIFYILITNYESPKDENGVSKYFFPGHVFVVERIASDSKPRFNIYQSYIGKYAMDEYMGVAKSLSIGVTKMQKFMTSLKTMMDSPVWTDETSQFWSSLTKTPMEHSNRMLGMEIPGNILLCYRISQLHDCNKALREFIDRHIGILNHMDVNAIYGKHENDEENEFEPMTVGQVLMHYNEIKDKID
jgi:hypothetical protein